jgi:hypothetical protein
MSPENKQETKPEKQSSDFQSELDLILNNPLTPENVDHYADYALNGLIDLTDKIVNNYKKQTGAVNSNTAEIENEAYDYYQLDGINQQLNYLIQKHDEIKALDSVIANAEIVTDIVTPPEVLAAMAIINGGGNFKHPTTIPRLKTLLFVLENEFNIETDNLQQFKLTKGILRDNMMRRESYYSVETPTLDRTTLVCDEEGNATFVFDDKKLLEHNIAHDDLIKLTKADIKDLIGENPTLGKRIIYSNQFVPNVVEAFRQIDNKTHDENDAQMVENISYLRPKAPDRHHSINELVKVWKISRDPIDRAISILGDQLGQVEKYYFRGRIANAYSPEQQETLYSFLTKNGNFASLAPEGYLPVNKIAEEWGFSEAPIYRAVSMLGDKLGEIKKYNFHNKFASVYSSEQQNILHSFLMENGNFTSSIPEEYLSVKEFADKWGINLTSIYRISYLLSDQLGEIKKFKINNNPIEAYSPEQQQIIYKYIAENNYLAPTAPDGYLTVNKVAEELGVNFKTVNRAISALGDSIGKINKYKFSNNITNAYSPEQRLIIKNYIDNRRSST